MDPLFQEWMIIPLIIFVARIAETSAKTIRQVYVGKGYRYLASGIGTAEVAIWLLSTGLVLTHLTSIASIFAYIAGYAVGTIVGIDIEERLMVGNVIVRIITRSDPAGMVLELREQGFGLTRLDGSGSFGSPVSVLLVIVPRSALESLTGILTAHYPDAIFSIEDIRSVRHEKPIIFREQSGFLSRFFGR